MLELLLCLSVSGLCADKPPTPIRVTGSAIQPQIAIDDAGRISVVFIQAGNIAVAVSKDKGQSFQTSVIAIDVAGHGTGGKQRGPRIGVDAKGTLHVTAPVTFDETERTKKYPTQELFLVSSVDGGATWSRPLQINEAVKKAPEALHWLAIDPSGVAHVAWLDLRGRTTPGQDLYYSRISGGVVSPNRRIAEAVCECCAPGLSVDASGTPFVAWREGAAEKPSREILAMRLETAGAPAGARQINGAPTQIRTCPMSAPAVAVSRDGKAFAAAWMDERNGSNKRRVYWSRGDSPALKGEEAIDSEARGSQDHPALTIDGAGDIWAAWELGGEGGRRSVWTRSSAPGSRPERANPEEQGNAAYPALASGGGIVGLVFESRGNGDPVIFERLR